MANIATRITLFATGMTCAACLVQQYHVPPTYNIQTSLQYNNPDFNEMATKDIFKLESKETLPVSQFKEMMNLHLQTKQAPFEIPAILITKHLKKLDFEDKDIVHAIDKVRFEKNQKLDISSVLNEIINIKESKNNYHISVPAADVNIIGHSTTITVTNPNHTSPKYKIKTVLEADVVAYPERTQDISNQATHIAYWITGLSTILAPDLFRNAVSKVASVGPNSIMRASGTRGLVWGAAVSFTMAFPFLFANHIRTVDQVKIPHTYYKPFDAFTGIKTSSDAKLHDNKNNSYIIPYGIFAYSTFLPIVCGFSAFIGLMVL